MISCSLPAGKGRPHFPRQYYIFSDRLLVLSLGRQTACCSALARPRPLSDLGCNYDILIATSAFHCEAEVGQGCASPLETSRSSLHTRIRDDHHASPHHLGLAALCHHQEAEAGRGRRQSLATCPLGTPASHPPRGLGAAAISDILCTPGRRIVTSRISSFRSRL